MPAATEGARASTRIAASVRIVTIALAHAKNPLMIPSGRVWAVSLLALLLLLAVSSSLQALEDGVWSAWQPSLPTVLSAGFQGSQLVLSQQGDLGGATDVIYGIGCRLCDRQLGNPVINGFLSRLDLIDPSKIGLGNINCVGQTTRSIRLRLRREQAGPVANTINEEAAIQPTHEHATEHLQKGDLPPGKQPRDAFRLMMDVIILLTVGEDLRSWECFWQFFCHCRRIVWGWNQR